MPTLRRHLLTHNTLAMLVIVVALAIRAIVPAGFMPMLVEERVVIALCSGSGPAVTMAHPAGMAHHSATATQYGSHDASDILPHDNKPQLCAFAGLGAPSLAWVDPVVLAVAIAFVLALGLRIVSTLPAICSSRLRPPLRGPPAIA